MSRVPTALVVDAGALYDVLQKKDLNSSAAGLKDKFSSLEVLCLLESLSRMETTVRWSEAQLADALTKPFATGSAPESADRGLLDLGLRSNQREEASCEGKGVEA